MKKRVLIILAFICIAFAGCIKPLNDGSLPAATADAIAANSYFPVTSGTYWVYVVGSVAGNDTLTIKMQGTTSVINNKTYFNCISNSKQTGTNVGYVYATNHLFCTRSTSATAALTIEFQVLIDTAAIGYSWTTTPTDSGLINSYPVRTVNTIKEKDITKVINGKIFSSVIHTQVDLQYNYGTGFQSYTTYDYYFAKGIGMIEQDATISGLTQTETILGYSIK